MDVLAVREAVRKATEYVRAGNVCYIIVCVCMYVCMCGCVYAYVYACICRKISMHACMYYMHTSMYRIYPIISPGVYFLQIIF